MSEECKDFAHDIRVAMALLGLVPTHLVLVSSEEQVPQLRDEAEKQGQGGMFRFDVSDVVPADHALIVDLCLHTGQPAPLCTCPCPEHRGPAVAVDL